VLVALNMGQEPRTISIEKRAERGAREDPPSPTATTTEGAARDTGSWGSRRTKERSWRFSETDARPLAYQVSQDTLGTVRDTPRMANRP